MTTLLFSMLMAAASLLLAVGVIVLAVRGMGTRISLTLDIEDLDREIADLEDRRSHLEQLPTARAWMLPLTRWRLQTRLRELRRRRIYLLESWKQRRQRRLGVQLPANRPPRSTGFQLPPHHDGGSG